MVEAGGVRHRWLVLPAGQALNRAAHSVPRQRLRERPRETQACDRRGQQRCAGAPAAQQALDRDCQGLTGMHLEGATVAPV